MPAGAPARRPYGPRQGPASSALHHAGIKHVRQPAGLIPLGLARHQEGDQLGDRTLQAARAHIALRSLDLRRPEAGRGVVNGDQAEAAQLAARMLGAAQVGVSVRLLSLGTRDCVEPHDTLVALLREFKGPASPPAPSARRRRTGRQGARTRGSRRA